MRGFVIFLAAAGLWLNGCAGDGGAALDGSSNSNGLVLGATVSNTGSSAGDASSNGNSEPNTGPVPNNPTGISPGGGSSVPDPNLPTGGGADPNSETGQDPNYLDPNLGDPNAGGSDPNAGDSSGSDPNLIAGDPNASDPNGGVLDPNFGDPNAADPNTMTDPNNSGDPNAGDPNAGDPNSGEPNAPYVSAAVSVSYHLTGAASYYIYEPAHASTAPLVVFLHAYNTLDPNQYSGWINHLLDGVNIVVYPVYQDYLSLDWQYTPNALVAIQNAYTDLAEPNHVQPSGGKFVVLTHSIGAVIGMNICAQATEAGLPSPAGLLMAAPGDADDVVGFPSIQMDSYSGIPASLRFIAVVGDNDTVVGTSTGIELYGKVPQIPTSLKTVIEFMSDSHGLPPLIAQHGSALSIAGQTEIHIPQRLIPQNPGGPITATIDTYDYKGYWLMADRLIASIFTGAAFSLPAGGSPNTVSLGTWSDGVAVQPALILLP